VGSRRLPQVRVVFAGCGTSFHAAQTGGEAVQALDLVHERLERADVFVLVSHEGQTPLTLEVAKSYPEVEKWLVTGAVESPLAEFCDEVVVATPRSNGAGVTPRATPVQSPPSPRSVERT
jgi:fructoselysine-6-P-deglycase FrlB-like protein